MSVTMGTSDIGDEGAVTGIVRDIVGWFVRDHQKVVEEVQRKFAERPADGALGEDVAGVVQASTFDVFRALTAGLGEGRGPTRREDTLLEAVGRSHAHRGVGLDAVEKGFAAAFGGYWDHLKALVDGWSHEQARRAGEVLSDRLLARYPHSLEVVRGGWRTVTGMPPSPAKVVDALLEGCVDPEALAALAREAGHDPGGDWGILVLAPAAGPLAGGPPSGGPPGPRLGRLVADLLDTAPGGIAGPVRMLPVPHVVVLTVPGWDPAADLATVEALAAPRGAVWAAGVVGRLTKVGEVYGGLRCVVHALEAIAPDRALPLDDLRIYWLLAASDPAHAADAVRMILGPLLATGREDWLATVEAYCDEAGDTKAAAKRLGITAQSVRRRMRTIAEATGVDPRGKMVPVTHVTGVMLRRIWVDDLPPLGDPAWA